MFGKILHVCPDAAPSSGVNCFCSRLNEALCAQGVDSSVVREYAPRSSPLIPQPSLLHLHGLWLGVHHQAAVWARQNGVPVVWSTHGMTAPWSMRHKWWKKLPAWWLYQKRDLQRAAVLHATSEQEVEWNRKLGLANRQVLVPLGSDLHQSPGTNPQSPGTKHQAPGTIILFVGRIYPVKGLMNLVRAAALLPPPPPAIRFRIVGPDQAGHRAELEAECARLGVKNVQFVGEKHGAELDAEYEACDVLALPSFTENFGGVVVDALAHGKPVIASKFTPWRELEEKGCGWWVDNAPESLAKTIAAAAGLPRERRVEMGEKGRALVEANFTWQAVAKSMLACYQSLI